MRSLRDRVLEQAPAGFRWSHVPNIHEVLDLVHAQREFCAIVALVRVLPQVLHGLDGRNDFDVDMRVGLLGEARVVRNDVAIVNDVNALGAGDAVVASSVDWIAIFGSRRRVTETEQVRLNDQ